MRSSASARAAGVEATRNETFRESGGGGSGAAIVAETAPKSVRMNRAECRKQESIPQNSRAPRLLLLLFQGINPLYHLHHLQPFQGIGGSKPALLNRIHHVFDDLHVVSRRALVGAVVVGGVGGGQRRQSIVFQVAVLHLVHVLPADF